MSDMHNLNIKRLDMGMLVALYLLLERRNISKVAREVGLSQPALSHSLSRMREIFQDQLLIRDGNELVLTPHARAIHAKLENLVPALQDLLQSSDFDPSISTAKFKIALTDHAGHVLLPEILTQMSRAAPHVESSIAIIPNRQTDLEDLNEGRFDTRIGWLRSLPPHWKKRKLCDERIVLICSPHHPDLQDADLPLSVAAFEKLQHIGLDSDRPIYPNMVDSLFAENGLTRNVAARVSHFAIVPFVVSQSSLCAMVPERLALRYAELNLVKIVKTPIQFPPYDLSLAWHPRVHADPGHVWLRKLIVECAGRILADPTGPAVA